MQPADTAPQERRKIIFLPLKDQTDHRGRNNVLDQNLCLIPICLQHTQGQANYQITYTKEFSSIKSAQGCSMWYGFASWDYLGLSIHLVNSHFSKDQKGLLGHCCSL